MELVVTACALILKIAHVPKSLAHSLGRDQSYSTCVLGLAGLSELCVSYRSCFLWLLFPNYCYSMHEAVPVGQFMRYYLFLKSETSIVSVPRIYLLYNGRIFLSSQKDYGVDLSIFCKILTELPIARTTSYQARYNVGGTLPTRLYRWSVQTRRSRVGRHHLRNGP